MSLEVRLIEYSLLTGQWDHTHIPVSAPNPAVNLSRYVVNGAFKDALTSSYARELFKNTHQSSNILAVPLDALFDLTINQSNDGAEGELIRLSLAVAFLHTFVQANWTGPDVDVYPLEIISLPPPLTEHDLNRKAISELACGGEPAYHLTQHATFLRFAQILLSLPYNHCQSAAWWRLRTALVHQQILDEPVGLPDNLLTSLEPFTNFTLSNRGLTGRLLLEKGLLEHHFGRDKSAADYFIRAARATGLDFELTGALGKRTKFQETDISQLVLLAESNLVEGSFEIRKFDVGSDEEALDNEKPAPAERFPETLALNDDTLLEHTEFTNSAPAAQDSRMKHIDATSQPALHPLDQCTLLAMCLNVKNTSPSHGLTNEQMSPYISRVITDPRNWSVHTMALLLRSRLESSRTRTVERSTLQLQALVDQMPTADSSLSERLLYFHSILLPSKWEMERELAMRFMSLGVVKSALEIFERLEMWEEVVRCWQSMERRDKAVTIVRDLLEGRKEESETVLAKGKATSSDRRQWLDTAREAKLWCLLGDLEPEKALEHYHRAWSVSKNTSGRAMRSLGGYHFARGEYRDAITCLIHAVSINPLLSRPWFILGCAYVRVENWEGGRDAFSRCVAIDEEDGESWNNLASVYLRMGTRSKDPAHPVMEEGNADNLSLNFDEETAKAIPFSNKMLAFRALKQGLKFSYENWRMWSNYMIVAMDVGELSEACRALTRIVEETSSKVGAKSVDEEVLERLVDAVTRAPTNHAGNAAEDLDINANDSSGLLRRVLDVLERTILPRVSAPRIFRSYARLLTWQSRWEDALKAYLDGYRCSTAGTMEKGETEIKVWREAITEVEEMVDILRNFGPRVEGYKWKLQARSMVRTFMGRTRDFEGEPEWVVLAQLNDELRNEE